MKIYDGTGQAAPARTALQAGALSLIYEEGALRYIRLGQHELVRGIYAAVRDQNWGTVPGVLRDVQMNIGQHTFNLTFTSEHRQPPVHFIWQGQITGSDDGTIQFTFEGEALSSFKRNRIGFCVLHPMELAGVGCEIEHTSGQVEQGTFPQWIAPHQPYVDLRALTHEVRPGVRVEVRMEGDTFEMEDQRNWTDASYKTYCTPLSQPFPVQVNAGDRVRQKITLRLIGTVGQVAITTSSPALQVEMAPAVPIPPLGLGCASHGKPLTAREIERLKPLNLAHLRRDLDASQPVENTLLRATDEALALGCGLEIAVTLGADMAVDLSQVQAAVEAIQPPIARWLIFRRGEKVTRQASVELARRFLAGYGAPIGAGTDAFFTELNRERPAIEVMDWVSYSINPQIHAFDHASLVETLPAQTATLASARQFCGDCPIAVSPVTLKMRWNPNATAAEPPPPPGELPRQVDPRQMSLFGAGWTLGSLKALIAGGAASLTFYETTGWLGVMEREQGSPLPEKFPSVPGGVYPLYHVLADVGEFAGGDMLPVTATAPLQCDGLLLRSQAHTSLLLANYTAEVQCVRVSGLSGGWRQRVLDETTADQAMRDPAGFRASPGQVIPAETSILQVDVRPYAVLRFDQI